MPINARNRAFLEEMASKGSAPTYTVTPDIARRNRDMPREPGPEVASVRDLKVEYEGGSVPVRVYVPQGLEPPYPTLVWFHGGGWVLGSLESADGNARRLAVGAQCCVVSVDYRLAPDWKFPTQVNDAYAATNWVAKHADLTGADPNRIAVGGDSAGGNLATVTCMLARDRGQPKIVFQLLIYPVTDTDLDGEMYRRRGEGTRLTAEHMRWFWNHYVRDKTDFSDPLAAPLKARDLSKLPPALIVTAEFDPLCDEGTGYAQRLREAGVAVELAHFDGVTHHFFGVPGRIDEGRQAVELSCNALKRAFRSS